LFKMSFFFSTFILPPSTYANAHIQDRHIAENSVHLHNKVMWCVTKVLENSKNTTIGATSGSEGCTTHTIITYTIINIYTSHFTHLLGMQHFYLLHLPGIQSICCLPGCCVLCCIHLHNW
jgi:hypothetical protein